MNRELIYKYNHLEKPVRVKFEEGADGTKIQLPTKQNDHTLIVSSSGQVILNTVGIEVSFIRIV